LQGDRLRHGRTNPEKLTHYQVDNTSYPSVLQTCTLSSLLPEAMS
jgi:hypothetical protein